MEKLRFSKNKLVALTAVGSLALGALTACGSDKPEFDNSRPAMVIDHKYRKPHTDVISVKPLLLAKYGPEWDLYLQQCGPQPTSDGQGHQEVCVTERIAVTEAEYDSVPDGSLVVAALISVPRPKADVY